MKHSNYLFLITPLLLISSCTGMDADFYNGSHEIKSSESSSEEPIIPPFSYDMDPNDDKVLLKMKASYSNAYQEYNVVLNYDPTVFDQTALIYNPQIARLSYAKSMAEVEKERIEFFLDDIGFDDQYISQSYSEEPTEDSVAYTFSHKEIDGYDLIAISSRCDNYKKEWSNNFMVGKDGDHRGYKECTNKVYNKLKTYLETYNGKNIKLWLTGYSRGGAVTNTLAQYILQRGEIEIEQSNMFVYTFEAPRSLDSDTVEEYENVFNLVNEADLIVKVPPKIYGLSRCGQDIDIYSRDIDQLMKDFDEYSELPPFKKHSSHYTTERAFVNYIIDTITEPQEDPEKDVSTRLNYFNNYQAAISYMLGVLFSLKPETQEIVMQKIKGGLGTILSRQDGLFKLLIGPIREDGIYINEVVFRDQCIKIREFLFGPGNALIPCFSDGSFSRALVHHYADINYVLLENYHDSLDRLKATD